MGRITCANVLSDLYAIGVRQVDSVDLILKLSNQMTEREQEIVTPMLIRGFADAAKEAGTVINRVVALENPWCTLGGIATAVLPTSDFIFPINAIEGDVLLLTKPLGTQKACAATAPCKWPRLEASTTKEELLSLHAHAVMSMGRLNRIAANLLHKYNAHAATDVTGFGILGHAQNLAKHQKNAVSFVIEKLPMMEHAVKVATALGMRKLLAGISPETSGGLLIALSAADADAMAQDLIKEEGLAAWKIGKVTAGNRTAVIIDSPEIIEVPFRGK